MDNSVRDPATRLDRRFYHVSRGQWTNSPIAGFRGDFAYFAFRLGTTRSLNGFENAASLVAPFFLLLMFLNRSCAGRKDRRERKEQPANEVWASGSRRVL